MSLPGRLSLALLLVSFVVSACRSTPLDLPAPGEKVRSLRVTTGTDVADGRGRPPLPRPPLEHDRALGTPPWRKRFQAGKVELKEHPWPSYVTGEERQRIEASIRTALEVGAREGRDAEDWLVSLDEYPKPGHEFRAVGRLISEFKRIVDRYGADNRDGLSRLMVIDRILRRIDGMQERDFDDTLGIRSQTTQAHALQVMRCWTWWYESEIWRNRQKPWDPWEDEIGEDE